MAPIADERLDAGRGGREGAQGHAGGDPRRGRPGHRPAAARQPAPGRRAAHGRARSPDEVEELRLELLVADRDHVERRLERVRQQAKSGDPKLRKEVADARAAARPRRGRRHGRRLRRGAAARARAADDEAGGRRRERPGRASTSRSRRSSPSSTTRRRRRSATAAVGARRDRGAAEGRARPDHVLHRRRQGDARVDAAPRPDGARRRRDDPLRHRPRLHPLRGDPLAATSSSAARARRSSKRGLQRLEGKEYVVEDGDVLNIRFNV